MTSHRSSTLVRSLSLGNVSTQAYALEDEGIQEDRRKRFHQDLCQAVGARGSVTENVQAQNEALSFEVVPFDNVKLPVSDITRYLQASWHEAQVVVMRGKLVIILPYARKGRGASPVPWFVTAHILWHASMTAACVAFLWLAPS